MLSPHACLTAAPPRSAAYTTISHLSLSVSVQPFLPASNPLQSYFPPRDLAVYIPVALMVVALGAIGAFYTFTMQAAAAKKKKKAA